MADLTICPMNYYTDWTDEETCIEIADNLLQNRINLLGDYFEAVTENIFDSVFTKSVVTSREELFRMRYLSSLLSAYRQTNNDLYRQKFLDIVQQFLDYYDRGEFSPSASDDIMPFGQTLMFVKSFSLITYEERTKAKIIGLLYSHAQYCDDNRNHWDNDNHGLFTDLALLHLSVLFKSLPESIEWQAHAVDRIRRLFRVAFYEDGFNNEGSMGYFRDNVMKYRDAIKFCAAYGISGLEDVRRQLNRCEKTLRTFAHSDGTYPMIGDGQQFSFDLGHNDVSSLCPHEGICVVKTGDMYLTLKYKSIMQAHTHVDDLSITARFQNLDLALDSGQYNGDRYHPINRFLRTSGGHSGIFPLFVDGLALNEYLARRKASWINRFDFDGTAYMLSVGYELDGGAIRVRRDITVMPDRIEVRDSWNCAVPQSMRQRFVLPKEFLEFSRFTASKNLFETTVEDVAVRYEVTSKDIPIVTSMNFGVQSKKLMEYEPTLLLDTIAENSTNGEITAVITIDVKEN